jgi:hypothetical protein
MIDGFEARGRIEMHLTNLKQLVYPGADDLFRVPFTIDGNMLIRLCDKTYDSPSRLVEVNLSEWKGERPELELGSLCSSWCSP